MFELHYSVDLSKLNDDDDDDDDDFSDVKCNVNIQRCRLLLRRIVIRQKLSVPLS